MLPKGDITTRPRGLRTSFFSIRRCDDTISGNKPHISSMLQTWSEIPASIAGGGSVWNPGSGRTSVWEWEFDASLGWRMPFLKKSRITRLPWRFGSWTTISVGFIKPCVWRQQWKVESRLCLDDWGIGGITGAGNRASDGL